MDQGVFTAVVSFLGSSVLVVAGVAFAFDRFWSAGK